MINTMKRLLTILLLSPAFLMAQSLTSTGNEVIYVKPGTAISSVDGFRLAGTSTNIFSIEQGDSPFNVAPASRRILMTNPNARIEIRNVANTQIANYYMDVNYASTEVLADLSIQNSNASATYKVGLRQIAHASFNDIPVEWTIQKTNATSTDVHNLIFYWGNELEPTQIPVKRLFMFDNATNDWVQLADANTTVDEFNNTLVYSGFEGDLTSKRFMIAQAKSDVTLTGAMTNFEWCSGAASAVQSFSVEATNLTQALTVTAPTNFEISLIPQGPFSTTLTINPIAFNVQPTVVYIRVAQSATTFGTFNIAASSTVVYYGSISDQLQVTSVAVNPNVSITAPANLSVSANSNCQATIPSLGTPVANVDCGTVTVTNNAPAAFPLGNTTVTWTATDAAGNTATATQVITVVDNTAPTIAGIPANITTGNTAGSCNATVTWTAPTAADNCAGVTLTSSHASGSVFALGTTTVTYTATDAAGHTTTASFTVTVNDTQNPTITAPAAVTVSANAACNAFNVTLGTPTTADNCGVASVTNNAPGTFPIGNTTVTWTVTDNAGNTATATQVVTVVDNTNPTIVAPVAMSVNAGSNCQAVITSLGNAVATDNCTVVTITNNAPAAFPLGNTTVTWTATDAAGNTATATQVITVVDNTAPTIAGIPANITTGNTAGSCNATVTWTAPTAADNCAGVTLTSSHASGSVFALGTTTVTYTATDAAGHTTTANFTVTVNDTEAPTIVAPANVTVNTNFGCEAIGVVLGAPSINDNCTISGVSNNAPAIYPLGNTTVTWILTDNAGNTASTTQIVTVVDNIAPQLTIPADIEVVANMGCDANNVSLGQATATDNCGIQSIVNNAPAIFPSGTTQVTWTATDNAGNQTSLVQLVTVLDLVAPTAVLQDLTITLPVGSDAIITSTMIDAGSSDNCGSITFELSQTAFNCNHLGDNKVVVTITDDNGNTTQAEITVTVVLSGIDADFDSVDDACDTDINTTTVEVPSGFTPDADGINDLFVIPGMSSYSKIGLTIYNRYGNVVYTNDGYQNDWDGTSNINGVPLPDGTYFYILELDAEAVSGYVYINRVQ